ncbi:hypothetical protein HKK55_11460 [Pseudomonas sp. ADAK18]|uniref:hypothetical protein n=1 Tax=Pseudomonas sp. ADAK18 TaxID=2730848 RepID=UPI0014628F95|nr:hypothetical protein [Pseudomonas sp. ADAK18]QJI29308.1 hypothetical protein HKK55_11460 [Pseudomonas sp. ADAK18]
MKPTMALKPLVFALAALMAVAAQAGGGGGWHPQPQPSGTVAAVVTDTQVNKDNKFTDEKTENNASANGSLNGSNGNLGANVASGSGNQQDNAAAIASSAGDALTVFALVDVYQESKDNKFNNEGTRNNASLNGSLNGSSGNAGANVAAGTGNQQKNNLAIVTSDGKSLAAVSNTDQQALANVYTNQPAGHGGYGSAQVVTNNASLNGSGNGSSGNLGVNIAAGAGNQQSNTLSLGSGCTQCAANVRF